MSGGWPPFGRKFFIHCKATGDDFATTPTNFSPTDQCTVSPIAFVNDGGKGGSFDNVSACAILVLSSYLQVDCFYGPSIFHSGLGSRFPVPRGTDLRMSPHRPGWPAEITMSYVRISFAFVVSNFNQWNHLTRFPVLFPM
jgi:hypothetical protein